MIFVAAFRRTPQHTEYFAQSVLIFDQASLCCVRKKQEPEKERREKKRTGKFQDWIVGLSFR